MVAGQLEETELVLDNRDVADRQSALWVILVGEWVDTVVDSIRQQHSLTNTSLVLKRSRNRALWKGSPENH